MKKFKVEYNKIKDTYTYYCDSIEELTEVLNELSKVLKENYVISVKVVYVTRHHRATARGYVSKYRGYKEFYKGRFGTGYKQAIPNSIESTRSNRFHYVDYFIEKN